jgi:hypothetical protein
MDTTFVKPMAVLPNELIHIIISKLSNEDYCSVQLAAKLFNVCTDKEVYLRKNSKRSLEHAIFTDDFEVFKYIYENRSTDTHHELTKDDLHEMSALISYNLIDYASRCGRLNVIKYLHSVGRKCTDGAIDEACRCNHLEIVKYLFSVGQTCSPWATIHASSNEDIECIKYLQSVGKLDKQMAETVIHHRQNNEIAAFLVTIT